MDNNQLKNLPVTVTVVEHAIWINNIQKFLSWFLKCHFCEERSVEKASPQRYANMADVWGRPRDQLKPRSGGIKAIGCCCCVSQYFPNLTFSNWIGWSRMVILHSYDILWVYYCMSFFTVWCNGPWASNSLRVASNYQTAPTLKACYLWPCHRPASWRCDGCSGGSFNGKEHTGILYSWFFSICITYGL